ncbi:MAG: UbiA family prenyltransferase [Candidatus Limnocylindrus sp.]
MTGEAYLLAILVSIVGIHGIARRWSPWTKRTVVLPVAFAVSIAFLLVDTIGLARGWFATPETATTLALPGAGPLGRGFPLEEPLLLFGISSLAVLAADLVGRGRVQTTRTLGLPDAVSSTLIGALTGAALGALVSGAEYTVASAALAGAGAALVWPLLVADRGSQASFLVFLLLTVIFDNLLCLSGLLTYPPAPRSGLLLWLMPVEDLLYAIGLVGGALRLRAEVIRGGGSAWRIFLASRPISWVNTGLPFLAGLIAAGAGERLGGWLLAPLLWWGAGYNLFLYGINDLYDRASDAENPRKGGAEGALLQERDLPPLRVALWAAGVLPAGVMAFVIPGAAGLAPLCAVGLATMYSAPWFARARSIPIFDSLVSSSHFLLPPIAGLLFARAFNEVWFASLSALALWGFASHALGAIQDVDADRRSGIRTIATLLGPSRTAWLILLTYVAAALPLAVHTEPLARIAAIIPLLSAASAVPLVRAATSYRSARAAWRRFLWLNAPLGAVASIILLESWRS